MRLASRVGLALLFSVTLATTTASAQRFAGAAEATLLGTSPFAGFGAAVAMSADGSRAVVGQYDGAVQDPGSALVFVRAGTTWSLESTITPADGSRGDGFGLAIAMTPDATRLVVGAPGAMTGSARGIVRIYTRVGTSWSLEAQLVPTVIAFRNADLGTSVAITADGGLALVGAPGYETVYCYTRAGSAWTLESAATASDGASGDRYGASVALSGDATRAIVGAPNAPHGASSAGAAYVLLRASASWTQDAELNDATPTLGAHFGAAAALDTTGARLVIGAPGASRVAMLARSGSAWTAEASFSPPSFVSTALGTSVVLAPGASFALVGATTELAAGASNGAVHEYLRTGATWAEAWTLARVPSAVLAGSATRFGTAIAIAADATRAIVGEPGLVRYPGDAFVYDDVGGACTSGATCPSGTCVDGVCCDSACGGAAADCMGCSMASTGAPEGRCAALAASVASTVVCRPAAGVCDTPESCVAGSTSCPTDRFLFTSCRTPMGVCDQEESCDGAHADCPPDRAQPAGVLCQPATSACMLDATCDGTSTSCPASANAPAGAPCRASSAACDPAETCTGSDSACPADINSCGVDAAAVDAASELDGGTTDAALDTDAAASLDGATLPDASMRDAGADAGAEAGARDGSAASPDAASAPAASAGCGCRASNGRAPGLVLACVISIALLAGRRARRRGLRATAVAPQVDGFRR